MIRFRVKIFAAFTIASLLIGTYLFCSKREGGSTNRVVLIGIDAGDWEILNRLVKDGKMPHFKKLMNEGSSGRLNSIAWRQLIYGSKGYYSPIVWATIATGKSPAKHGIEDFTLPLPSRLVATLVPATETGYASIQLPEISRSLSWILIKAKSASPDGSSSLDLYLNQTFLKQIKLGKTWQMFHITIPPAAIADSNELHFYYQINKADVGKPADEFNYIRLYDSNQEELSDLHFLRDKALYKEGWQLKAPDIMTTASSFHFRASTLWDILSQQKQKVAVIGWWSTYPATHVNGFLISSHVGHQGRIMKGTDGNNWFTKLKRLTYPEEYLNEVKKQIFLPNSIDSEIVRRFYDLGRCSCIGSKQDYLFKSFYWQDRLFETLGIDLLKTKGPFDFFAIYFRGVDTAGHQFLQFTDESEALKNCTGCDVNRLSEIVNNYYIYMDEAVGKVIQYNDPNTVTLIVTDHGQYSSGSHGNHRNNGFVVLHGTPIRRHNMIKANVVDVAPTVLYLLGVPVAQDMDGSVMLEAFDPNYLSKHPVKMTGTYESPERQEKKAEVIDQQRDEQELEELKALGYIQ
jgi:predicted AlkP superfamily phosphohydrolase/phosphomutase